LKSRIFGFNQIIALLRTVSTEMTDSKITVFAAQASFFVITSAVPFVSLLIAVLGTILPSSTNELAAMLENNLPPAKAIKDILGAITSKIEFAPPISLLSFSAITTLWSASRGIAAVRGGIETVYLSSSERGIVKRKLKSIISTVMFMILIGAAAALLLFGDFIGKLFGSDINSIFFQVRIPIFIIFMSLMFTFMYTSAARRSIHVNHDMILHLPGALFSAIGWIVFSYFYSLYLSYFPGASYIYGSLAAICLIMLWIYFCMIILLLGAVINKLFFCKKTPDAKK